MRVKRGVTSHARHKRLRAQTKGMQLGRRTSVKLARQAVLKSLSYSYRDRRTRKRSMRSLWITRINAAANQNDLSYSQLMGLLKQAGIELDRKVLADLASTQPSSFKAIVTQIKANTKPKSTATPKTASKV